MWRLRRRSLLRARSKHLSGASPNLCYAPQTRNVCSQKKTFLLTFMGKLETSGLNLDHLDPYLPDPAPTFFPSLPRPCTICTLSPDSPAFSVQLAPSTQPKDRELCLCMFQKQKTFILSHFSCPPHLNLYVLSILSNDPLILYFMEILLLLLLAS